MATSNVLFARPFIAQFAPVTTRRRQRHGSIAFSDLTDSSSYISSSADDTSDFELFKPPVPHRLRPPPPPPPPSSTGTSIDSIAKSATPQPAPPQPSLHKTESNQNSSAGRPVIQACNHLAVPRSLTRLESPPSRDSLDLGIPWRGGGASSSSSRDSSVSSVQPKAKRQSSSNHADLSAAYKRPSATNSKADVLHKFLEEQRRVRNRLAEMTSHEPIRRLEVEGSKQSDDQTGLSSPIVAPSASIPRWAPPNYGDDDEEEDEDDTDEGEENHLPQGRPSHTPLRSPLPATEPDVLHLPRRRLSCSSQGEKVINTVELPTQKSTSGTEVVDGVARQVIRRVTRIQRHPQLEKQRVQSNLQKPSPLASPAGPNRLLVRKLPPSQLAEASLKPLVVEDETSAAPDVTPVQATARRGGERDLKVDLRSELFRVPGRVAAETARPSRPSRDSLTPPAIQDKSRSRTANGRDTLQQLKDLERTQRELASRQHKLERSQAELEARQMKKERSIKSTTSSALMDSSSSAPKKKKMPVETTKKRLGTIQSEMQANEVRRLKLSERAGAVADSSSVAAARHLRTSRQKAIEIDRPLSSAAGVVQRAQYGKSSAASGPQVLGASPDSSDELRSLRDVTSQFTATQQTIQPTSVSSSNHMFRLPDGFDPSHLQAPVLRDLCLRNIPLDTILPHHEIEFVLVTPSNSDSRLNEQTRNNRISLPGASPSDLQRKGFNLHRINSGTFSSVYKAVWRGLEVAVKCPDENLLKSDGTMMRYRALQEWRILSRVDHPCILHFHGGVILRDQLWLVTDYIKGGDLYSLLYHRPPEYLRPRIRLSLMEQLCESVAYLHSLQPRIAHKDLKCNNLLVGSDLRLRVCDFGDAEEMNGRFLQFCTAATWQYTPPELIGTEDPARPQNATEKVDLWAVGCVFLEILRCSTPFVHILDSVIDSRQRETLRQCYLQNRLQKECRIPTSLPPRLRMLVKSCLNFDSEARPSAAELLEVIRNSKESLLREMIGWQSRWETPKIQQKGDLKSLDAALIQLREKQSSKHERGTRFTSTDSSNRIVFNQPAQATKRQPCKSPEPKVMSGRRLLADRASAVDMTARRPSIQRLPNANQFAPLHNASEIRLSTGAMRPPREIADIASESYKADWQPLPLQSNTRFAPPPLNPDATNQYSSRQPARFQAAMPYQLPPPPLARLHQQVEAPLIDTSYLYTARTTNTRRNDPNIHPAFGSLAGSALPIERLLPVQSVSSERPVPMLQQQRNNFNGGGPAALSPRMTMIRNSTETRLPGRAMQPSLGRWPQQVYLLPTHHQAGAPTTQGSPAYVSMDNWGKAPAVYPPPNGCP